MIGVDMNFFGIELWYTPIIYSTIPPQAAPSFGDSYTIRPNCGPPDRATIKRIKVCNYCRFPDTETVGLTIAIWEAVPGAGYNSLLNEVKQVPAAWGWLVSELSGLALDRQNLMVVKIQFDNTSFGNGHANPQVAASYIEIETTLSEASGHALRHERLKR
jgi:hypothetical protein